VQVAAPRQRVKGTDDGLCEAINERCSWCDCASGWTLIPISKGLAAPVFRLWCKLQGGEVTSFSLSLSFIHRLSLSHNLSLSLSLSLSVRVSRSPQCFSL
jgi:hypothetical protein